MKKTFSIKDFLALRGEPGSESHSMADRALALHTANPGSTPALHIVPETHQERSECRGRNKP